MSWFMFTVKSQWYNRVSSIQNYTGIFLSGNDAEISFLIGKFEKVVVKIVILSRILTGVYITSQMVTKVRISLPILSGVQRFSKTVPIDAISSWNADRNLDIAINRVKVVILSAALTGAQIVLQMAVKVRILWQIQTYAMSKDRGKCNDGYDCCANVNRILEIAVVFLK